MARYLVTGASRGIGEALVRQLTKDGHQVLALARNRESLEKLQGDTGCAMHSADLLELDSDRLKQFIAANGIHLDGIVHNAGSLVNKPFFELKAEEVRQVYEVNAISAFALLQVCLPFVNKGGHIVSISSIGGMNGSSKYPGLSAYSSSKASIGVLMECLQAEFSERDWAFNALALGAVSTNMLKEAFPGYEAPVDPAGMAAYISNFLYTGHQVIRGKVLPISLSNP